MTILIYYYCLLVLDSAVFVLAMECKCLLSICCCVVAGNDANILGLEVTDHWLKYDSEDRLPHCQAALAMNQSSTSSYDMIDIWWHDMTSPNSLKSKFCTETMMLFYSFVASEATSGLALVVDDAM
jgi:hypothetical protein